MLLITFVVFIIIVIATDIVLPSFLFHVLPISNKWHPILQYTCHPLSKHFPLHAMTKVPSLIPPTHAWHPPVGEDGEYESTEGISCDGEGEDGGDGGGVVAHEVEEADGGLSPAALVVVPTMLTSLGFGFVFTDQ